MPENTSPDEPKFRICIELADLTAHTFDNLPGDVVAECVQAFVDRTGDGLAFVCAEGTYSWPWDEIRGVGALRMVALTDVEMQPLVARTTYTVQAPATT